MNILNYFFMGFAVTFIVDLFLNLEYVKKHPRMENIVWGMRERMFCIIIWPLALLIYLFSFIKARLKK